MRRWCYGDTMPATLVTSTPLRGRSPAIAGANMCQGSWLSRSFGDRRFRIGKTLPKVVWRTSLQAGGGRYAVLIPHFSRRFHPDHQMSGRAPMMWRGVNGTPQMIKSRAMRFIVSSSVPAELVARRMLSAGTGRTGSPSDGPRHPTAPNRSATSQQWVEEPGRRTCSPSQARATTAASVIAKVCVALSSTARQPSGSVICGTVCPKSMSLTIGKA